MMIVNQHTRKKIDGSLSSSKLIKMLVIFTVVSMTTLLHLATALPGQKRVYMTRSGQEKVKRYLQRRHREYFESRYPGGTRPEFYTNTWAVVVDPPTKEVADIIAKKHGFINIGKIGNQEGHYHFKHVETSSKIEKRDHIKTGLLTNEKEVLVATQQKVLERFKRDGFPTDPEFKKMWYLHNNGQGRSPGGVDLRVPQAWKQGYTGKGIVISVLDDGLDHTHPDLEPNYDKEASCDLNDNDDDPMPRDTDPDNCHGTRCAGEAVAAANNSICGVGIAYNSKVGGVRMLDGQATDALEASALGFKNNHIDIYINCWGPKDDGKTFGKPGPIATNALKEAAEKGRDGKGNIFVWATGNGGLTDDDCNCDGYTTSIYTISIGCIGDHGTSAYYTEKCSSTLAVTFNGASHREGRENPMITTDLYHGCTEEFKGTSASAPLAAGVIALVLEANPKLTWRGIQDAIVRSAQITSPVDEGWKRNGADFHYNLKFGFGRLDTEELLKAAKNAKALGPHTKCVTGKSNEKSNIPAKAGAIRIPIKATECLAREDEDSKQEMPKRLEHVVLTVSFVHKRRGDVSIKLFSPSGTESEMLSTRKYDDSTEGLDEWNFMTVFNWGEDPKGEWHVVVANNPEDETDVASFGSDSNNDVESLEEDVIDAQMKSKQKEWDQRREKDPFFSLPYPKGVKRSDIPSKPEEERANEPTAENKDFKRREFIEQIDDLISRKTIIPRPRGDTVGRLLHVDENNDFNEVPITENESRAKIPHRGGGKRTTSHLFKKVQVQEEETGVPRVQVNAGYEKAPIECQGGEDCSGVLLNWKLTLFGGL